MQCREIKYRAVQRSKIQFRIVPGSAVQESVEMYRDVGWSKAWGVNTVQCCFRSGEMHVAVFRLFSTNLYTGETTHHSEVHLNTGHYNTLKWICGVKHFCALQYTDVQCSMAQIKPSSVLCLLPGCPKTATSKNLFTFLQKCEIYVP